MEEHVFPMNLQEYAWKKLVRVMDEAEADRTAPAS